MSFDFRYLCFCIIFVFQLITNKCVLFAFIFTVNRQQQQNASACHRSSVLSVSLFTRKLFSTFARLLNPKKIDKQLLSL